MITPIPSLSLNQRYGLQYTHRQYDVPFFVNTEQDVFEPFSRIHTFNLPPLSPSHQSPPLQFPMSLGMILSGKRGLSSIDEGHDKGHSVPQDPPNSL